MKTSGEGAERDIRKETEVNGGRGGERERERGHRRECQVSALCTQRSPALFMHHCKTARDPCNKDEAHSRRQFSSSATRDTVIR